MIKILKEKCPKDHICPMINLCNQKAVSQKGFDAPIIDHKKCIGCMVCVQRCPYKAFKKVD